MYVRERATRSAFTQLALNADWSHRPRGDGDIHSVVSPPLRGPTLYTHTRVLAGLHVQDEPAWRGTRMHAVVCVVYLSLSLSFSLSLRSGRGEKRHSARTSPSPLVRFYVSLLDLSLSRLSLFFSIAR